MPNHIYLLPGSKLYALLDHIFAEYLFLCPIDAHGKTLLCGSHQVPLDYEQTKHVWYTQQLIVGDNIFSVPSSSSYTHQVSNCHSNLETTPSSSIDLTSKSAHHLSLPVLCRIFLILDKLRIECPRTHYSMLLRMESIPVWRISMEIISTHTTSTCLVVPIRAYKRLNIFAILSIASLLLDQNINPPKYIMHSASM